MKRENWKSSQVFFGLVELSILLVRWTLSRSVEFIDYLSPVALAASDFSRNGGNDVYKTKKAGSKKLRLKKLT